MLISDENKLSYIKHLMFREEFENMMSRDFSLNPDKPFNYETSIISEVPPVISSVIKEIYTYYPIDSEPFEIKIRNLMIEQELLNNIQIISDIYFPDNMIWPIVTDKEEQYTKKMTCFTGGTPSIWNIAAIDKPKQYHLMSTYLLACRESYRGRKIEIVQMSNFDPYRMIEYFIKSSDFETDLNKADEAKWRSTSKVKYSLKKSKNEFYQLF